MMSVSTLFNLFSSANQKQFLTNSADNDETAHNEPSHQDLHCLLFCSDFWLRPLFGIMVLTRFKDRKRLLQKLRDERVKLYLDEERKKKALWNNMQSWAKFHLYQIRSRSSWSEVRCTNRLVMRTLLTATRESPPVHADQNLRWSNIIYALTLRKHAYSNI